MIIIYAFKKYLLSISYVPGAINVNKKKDKIWTLILENPLYVYWVNLNKDTTIFIHLSFRHNHGLHGQYNDNVQHLYSTPSYKYKMFSNKEMTIFL